MLNDVYSNKRFDELLYKTEDIKNKILAETNNNQWRTLYDMKKSYILNYNDYLMAKNYIFEALERRDIFYIETHKDIHDMCFHEPELSLYLSKFYKTLYTRSLNQHGINEIMNISIHYDESIIKIFYNIDLTKDLLENKIKDLCFNDYRCGIKICSFVYMDNRFICNAHSAFGYQIIVILYPSPNICSKVYEGVIQGYKNTIDKYFNTVVFGRGIELEHIVALQVGGSVWNSLPKETRQLIHGNGMTTGDRGVDIIDLNLSFYQVKDYDGNVMIGHDVIAKINNIAESFITHGGKVLERFIIGRVGNKMSSTAPGRGLIKFKTINDENDFGDLKSLIEQDPYADGTELRRKLEEMQTFIVNKLFLLRKPISKICLPTGTGKSKIIKRVAQKESNDGNVVIILSPRVNIVEQLRGEVAGLNNVYLSTAQGFNPESFLDITIPKIIIIDEAHWGAYGTDRFSNINKINPIRRYLVSATLDDPDPDFYIPFHRAVTEKLICEPELIVPLYSNTPSVDNIKNYIENNPRHQHILIFHQTQEQAVNFFKEYNDNSGIYTSDHGDKTSLILFKEGKIRILNVVLKTEMGTDIPITDTIILMCLWKSKKRLLQIIGRGTRFHGVKGSKFSVVLPSTEENLKENKDIILETMKELYDNPPKTKIYMERETESGSYEDEPKNTEISKWVRTEVYDYKGKAKDPRKQRLKDEYHEIKRFFFEVKCYGKDYGNILRNRYPHIDVELEDYFSLLGFKPLKNTDIEAHYKYNYDDIFNRPLVSVHEQREIIKRLRFDYRGREKYVDNKISWYQK